MHFEIPIEVERVPINPERTDRQRYYWRSPILIGGRNGVWDASAIYATHTRVAAKSVQGRLISGSGFTLQDEQAREYMDRFCAVWLAKRGHVGLDLLLSTLKPTGENTP